MKGMQAYEEKARWKVDIDACVGNRGGKEITYNI